MKTILAIAALALIALVYSETCVNDADCTQTICADANNTVSCMRGECTCGDASTGGNTGGNTGTACQGNGDCHHHHATHCAHGQHAVCMNGMCECRQH